ncbi:unnamed protein product [Calypogeia fissa]
MAKGSGSFRLKAPLGGQAEVALPPDPMEAQPNVATRATTSAGKQKEQVENDPSWREEYLSDEREEDYDDQDEHSPSAQEFDISEDDDKEDVIRDNLAPSGVGSAGGSKPPPKVDKVPQEKKPTKERQPKERPHTTSYLPVVHVLIISILGIVKTSG